MRKKSGIHLLLASITFNAIVLFELSRDSFYARIPVGPDTVGLVIGGITVAAIAAVVLFNACFFTLLRKFLAVTECNETLEKGGYHDQES
ncbi:MAG: hypothetical protein AB1805_17135 [Nitrospirota bacterium]